VWGFLFMTKNGTIQWRVEQLEKNYESLDRKVSKILENELPHLQEHLASISTQVKVLGAINVIGILSIIAITQALK